MTDAKQTKCPHCGSTFRISDAQLAAKGGSVRCGSCLQVFRADLHLVGETPRAVPAHVPATAKPKKKGAGNDESWALALLDEKAGKTPAAAATEDWDIPGLASAGSSDEFGFSDDDISAFMVSDQKAAPSSPPPGQGRSLRFDDELSDFLDEAGDGLQQTEAGETSHVLSESADESWAKSILSELEHEEKKQDNQKYGMEILDGKSKAPPKNPKLAAAMGMGSRVAEEPVSRKAQARQAAAPAPAAPTDDFLSDDADVLSFLDNDDLSSNSPTPLAPNPFSLDRPLAHVDAPVVLKPRREPINWGHLLSWTFLCLVAAAMFAAQYVYFNFEALAIKPSTRPWFEQACTQFGCRLPDIPDPSKLRVEELIVRKHATVEGALVVDAIVKNNARFPQPMPVLLLRFSNNANEVVASRQLKPMDYLRGEARLLRRMPPDTPIRISLDIVDPGATAVNYSLDPVL
jgi:predicted Zn finger-like uncharacterized protein